MAAKAKVLRVSIHLKRKPGLTLDEFNKYWTEVHAPLVRPLLEKYGVLKYTQYQTSDTLRRSAIEAWPELASLSATPYDGVAEFLVRDMMDIKRSREDPLFVEQIAPDEERFFDVRAAACTVGWEEVYIEDGKVVSEDQSRLNAP